MARALMDISGVQTVSSNSQVEIYKLTVPPNAVLILREVSIASNSTFQSDGRISLQVGGDILTSSGDGVTEVQVDQNITLPFPDPTDNAIFLKGLRSGESVILRGRVTGANAGTVNVAVTGILISPQQWEELLKKGKIGI